MTSRQIEEKSMNKIIRYVLTYVNDRGVRTLLDPAQGRFTYARCEEAEAFLREFLSANTPERLQGVFGKDCVGTFAVRPVECWPQHFDPKTCWFDE
jgi:hypothetical protein